MENSIEDYKQKDKKLSEKFKESRNDQKITKPKELKQNTKKKDEKTKKDAPAPKETKPIFR